MSTRDHINTRLGYFVDRGMLDHIPTPWQVKVGLMAMLPVTLSESDRERDRSRSTWLGQIPLRVPLQLLYCPRQFFADTGLTLRPDQLVRHVLSVYHEDAFLGYDLQLLQSHSNGLALLRREARRVLNGESRWAPLLRRMVGWPTYHEDLITLSEAAERFEYPDILDLDPRFVTLVGFARFCNAMPRWPKRSFYSFDLGRIARRKP